MNFVQWLQARPAIAQAVQNLVDTIMAEGTAFAEQAALAALPEPIRAVVSLLMPLATKAEQAAQGAFDAEMKKLETPGTTTTRNPLEPEVQLVKAGSNKPGVTEISEVAAQPGAAVPAPGPTVVVSSNANDSSAKQAASIARGNAPAVTGNR